MSRDRALTGPILLEAVVFDFDGLIFDSETPIYRASAAALASLGHELTVQAWSTVVGHGDDGGWAALQAAIGADLDREAYDQAYEAQDRSWRDTQPALPGVADLLAALGEARLPCAIASSSPSAWVETHLERLGLRSRFASIATRDRVGGRAKPAPDTYLLACADLGADPARSVAIEDSAPGIAAARAANLSVVCVPSEITAHTDLSGADLQVTDLTEVSVADLVGLVADQALSGGS